MTAFFAKPKIPLRPSQHELPTTPLGEKYRNITEAGVINAVVSPCGVTAPKLVTDYERTFLPFSIPSNTTFAPPSLFTWDTEARAHMESNLFCTETKSLPLSRQLSLVGHESIPRGRLFPRVKDLVSALFGSPLPSTKVRYRDPRTTLSQVPVKYLFYHDDVRPPYIGTNTRIQSLEEYHRLARAPFRRLRAELDYDNDSELEWEDDEGEDAEDLRSEGASENESADDDEEMDSFLDDEEGGSGVRKRKLLDSNLAVMSTGLCWQDELGTTTSCLAGDLTSVADYRMRLLNGKFELLAPRVCFLTPSLEPQSWPIDPFAKDYWSETTADLSKSDPPPGIKNNDCISLQARLDTDQNTSAMPLLMSSSAKTAAKQPKGPVRLMAGSELQAFKDAVQGSQLKKAELLSKLKKQ